MGLEKSFHVSLDDQEARFVADEVALGHFGSANEVIVEAVRALQAETQRPDFSVQELRRLAEDGERSGTSQFATMDDLKAEARRRFAAAKPAS